MRWGSIVSGMVLAAWCGHAFAQEDANPADGSTASEAEAATSTTEAAPAEPMAAPAPKVAIVVVGDPDPELVAFALEIEARSMLSGGIRFPTDAALRAALRGDDGAAGDGLDEVRRERRRLGLGEASDAPILAALGRRAGAVVVIAVRASASGLEAVALDVQHSQFFDGGIEAHADAERIADFVTRRARAAAQGASPALDVVAPAAPDQAAPGVAAATAEPHDEPDWFEQNWPYFAAGALLAGAIVFVAVTATDGGDPPPMLRFQPGAR